MLIPRLGLFSTVMIVIGSIIGSGIFKKIAPMTAKLQSESLVMWCWLIAGVITLFGALTYAEIAGRVAQTGGLYSYLRVMYGKTFSFLFGWACFSVIQSASIASIAYVFAEAILRVLPFSFFESPDLNVKTVAVSTILLLTTINYLGVLFGAIVENIFTVTKIFGILLVVVLGFTFQEDLSSSASTVISLPLNPPQGAALLPMMFSAMLGAFWAFDGFNNVGFVGGEVKDAKRNIPLALIFGVSGVLGIYVLVNFAYFHALSLNSILAISQMPGKVFAIEAIEMLQQISGSSWALFVAALVMASTFGATNGSILTSARIYYAMAKDGVFFSRLGTLHPQFNTPSSALLVQAVWASVLVMSGSFDQLTDMLIFASFIFYGLGAFGLFILRKRKIGDSKFVVPTLIPILYIIFCVILVSVTLYQDPMQSLYGIALILAGIPFYLFAQRKKALRGLDTP